LEEEEEEEEDFFDMEEEELQEEKLLSILFYREKECEIRMATPPACNGRTKQVSAFSDIKPPMPLCFPISQPDCNS
jgi:hypothetical protein